MNEKDDEQEKMDDLSRLQGKLDDLGVMFYTYLGIIQRDAPPSERAPDEADEVANDQKAREELTAKIPGFAKSVVQTSMEFEKIIDEVETKMKSHTGKEREMLDTANYESRQAGDEMTEAAESATKLLSSLRQAISARENET